MFVLRQHAYPLPLSNKVICLNNVAGNSLNKFFFRIMRCIFIWYCKYNKINISVKNYFYWILFSYMSSFICYCISEIINKQVSLFEKFFFNIFHYILQSTYYHVPASTFCLYHSKLSSETRLKSEKCQIQARQEN